MFRFGHSLYNNAYGGGAPAVDNDFVIRVKTDNTGTSASNQFTIPTSSGTYDYNITTDEHSLTGQTGSVTLTFSTAGEYVIRISGTFPTIYFNNGGDRLKLIETLNFGDVGWTTLQNSFWNCTNNVINPACTGNFDNVTSLSRAFASNISNNFFPAINFPSCTNAFQAFLANSFTSFPAISFDVCTNFNFTFGNIGVMSSFSLRNFYTMNDGTNCFSGTTLPTSDYSDILITQNANNANTGVTFHGGNSNYDSSATSARANLVGTKLWTITDAGLV